MIDKNSCISLSPKFDDCSMVVLVDALILGKYLSSKKS